MSFFKPVPGSRQTKNWRESEGKLNVPLTGGVVPTPRVHPIEKYQTDGQSSRHVDIRLRLFDVRRMGDGLRLH
jgi:hypothetical protein